MKPAPRDAGRDLATIDALLLCGGLGTRLRPVVSDRPKCLAPVAGKPFLELLLADLEAQGLRRFVLCVGHRADDVVAAQPALESFGEIVLSREDRPLGTAGALRRAADHVRSDPVLAMNGDSLAAVDLRAMLAFHRVRCARATLALVPAQEDAAGRAAGAVALDSNGRVIDFQEKPRRSRGGHVNAGVYFLARELLESIPSGRMVSLERDVFPALLPEGLFGFICSGFYDIGTPERYALAPRELEALTAPRGRVNRCSERRSP